MKSKTAVCAYGKDGSVDRVFERLFTMYLSNYSESYCYGAVIDLPDSVCYRAIGDAEREERAKTCVDHLNKSCDGSFFCAVRQRRYASFSDGYGYSCEDGALGALKGLWRYLGGRKNELFPVYGCVPSEVERIYFSSLDEEMGGVVSEKNSFECIEPNGIFRLSEQLTAGGAAFPCLQYPKESRSGFFGMRRKAVRQVTHEALYTSEALDVLLAVGATLGSVKSAVSELVKMRAYPCFTLVSGKETERTLIL